MTKTMGRIYFVSPNAKLLRFKRFKHSFSHGKIGRHIRCFGKSPSTHFFGQFNSAEQVKMKMLYGLACILAAI